MKPLKILTMAGGLFQFLFGGVNAAQTGIPIENFVKNNLYDEVKISPNGEYMAVTVPHENKKVLVFLNTNDLSIAGGFNVKDNERIDEFYWANHRRVVFTITHLRGFYEYPADYGEIFAANFDGSQAKSIFGYRAGDIRIGSRIKSAEPMRAWGEILHELPQDEDHILISARSWSNTRAYFEIAPIAYRLNIHSGEADKVSGHPGKAGDFIVDNQGEIRGAYNADENWVDYVYWRESDKTRWRLLEQGYVMPAGFNRDETKLLLLARSDDSTSNLYAREIENGKKSLLFKHEQVDVDTVIPYPDGKGIMAIGYMPDYPAVYFLQPNDDISRAFRSFMLAFKQHHIRITSATRDLSKVVVEVSSDKNPGDFYLFNVVKNEAKFLLSRNHHIQAGTLADMQPIQVTARDGLVLHGYLTRPKGKEKQKHLPMIVIPHGGPRLRDRWEYQPDVQFLASRGYAVLQINFRGSEGYGQAFLNAGNREWGGKIQQDIIDATRWAIGQEIADENRICIYGASFGAYSAIMNVILVPELYRCAAGYAGIYDLELMHKRGDIRRNAYGKYYLETSLGRDEHELQQYSPVHRAADINTPLLLIHGGQDERAPIKHAELLRKALKEKGISHEWLVKKTEGHGFFNEQNRIEVYQRLLAFFNRHTMIKSRN